MRQAKLPHDAFEFYAALGSARSHAHVAKQFDVALKTVNRTAKKERWQERLIEFEKKAREASEKKALETIEQLNERHLKVLKVLQAKALEALRNLSMSKASDVIRALEVTIRTERTIRGIGEDGIGIEVNVHNKTVTVGPPVPTNESLGHAIGRLSELAKVHGLFDEHEDEDGDDAR